MAGQYRATIVATTRGYTLHVVDPRGTTVRRLARIGTLEEAERRAQVYADMLGAQVRRPRRTTEVQA